MAVLLGMVGITTNLQDCRYFFGNKPPVDEPLSVLALRGFLQPAQTMVLCTARALEAQREHLAGVNIIEIPNGVNEQEFREIFSRVLQNLKGEEIYVDLTQGFRHLPMLMMLGVFLKGLSGGNISMYYAMDITDAPEHSASPVAERTPGRKYFQFQPVHDYLEIGYISMVFNLFAKSFNISGVININSPVLRRAVNALHKVAQSMLENNIHETIHHAGLAYKQICEFLESPDGQFVKENAQETLALLLQIQELKDKPVSEQMLTFGRIMLERRYLLSAATLLYESFLKALREYVDFDKYARPHVTSYTKSQAIKQLFNYGKLNNILKEKFTVSENPVKDFVILKEILDNAEEIRNTAAHGFLDNDGSVTHYEKRLRQLYEQYSVIYQWLEEPLHRLLLKDRKKFANLQQLYEFCRKELSH